MLVSSTSHAEEVRTLMIGSLIPSRGMATAAAEIDKSYA